MNASAEVITLALRAHADDAPTGDTLLADVRQRLRHRRRVRSAGAGVLACTAVAAAATGVGVLHDAPAPTAGAPVAVPPGDVAVRDVPRVKTAEGWHWESYDTVQVQIPDSWIDTSYSHLWTCQNLPRIKPAPPRSPLVGRPFRGAVPMMSCGPVSPLAERVPHLWFGERNRAPGVYRYDHGWLEEVRVVGGVHLSAFGNDSALLKRILDSARPIDGADAYGCSPTAPATLAEGMRPTGPGLGGIREVESVRICGYAVAGLPRDAVLLAGSSLTGAAARQVAAALRSAPAGPGPNHEYHCEIPQHRDDLVVTVRGSTGEQEVLVRYDSCNHNGTDDGTTLRQLTRDALLPLVRTLYGPTLEPMITERLPR
ncbi:hypothetical protein [Kribbella sp. NPDC051770]|uniref:hypothetical protein n=1 Tax=Kribbella sp. NPDC051770 TaxID=3155413 RepID=UPI003434D17B